MTVGIVGLGLIGGSMAIDLKRRGFASRVLGVEQRSECFLKSSICSPPKGSGMGHRTDRKS